MSPRSIPRSSRLPVQALARPVRYRRTPVRHHGTDHEQRNAYDWRPGRPHPSTRQLYRPPKPACTRPWRYALTHGEQAPKRFGIHHFGIAPLGGLQGKEGYIVLRAVEHQMPQLTEAVGCEELMADPKFGTASSGSRIGANPSPWSKPSPILPERRGGLARTGGSPHSLRACS